MARSVTKEHPLAKATRQIDAVCEALRLSYLALLSAACFAEEHGDKKAARFYDRQAEKDRKALVDLGILEKRTARRVSRETPGASK